VRAANVDVVARPSKRVACTLLAVASLTASFACVAEGWYLTIGGGLRSIDVDSNSPVANSLSTDDNVVAELGAGYVFANNLVIEGAVTDAASVTGLFGVGSYELDDYRVMVGYAFPVSEKFRIVPAAGASFWDFRAMGSFFSSAPERSLSGTDFVWRLGGEFLVGDTFGISFGYTSSQFDAGDSFVFGVDMRIQF
jgi:hypothetical protein